MKKSLILIPLILFSCKKESAVTETLHKDSAKISDKTVVENPIDSAQIKDSIINNAPATKEVLRTGVMRNIDGKTITREADAEQMPFTIGEEFTQDNEEFILKIKNVKAGKISAKISPAENSQNIRFNQIKLPDSSYDGPFGREVSYDIKKDGEVWLIIGKSNMASGETKGKFSVSVE